MNRPSVPLPDYGSGGYGLEGPDDVSTLPVDLGQEPRPPMQEAPSMEQKREEAVGPIGQGIDLDPEEVITEKVTSPDPVALDPLGVGEPDTEKVREAGSGVLSDVVQRSQSALGGYTSPPDTLVVTQESLEEAGDNTDNAPFKLIIDPNKNIAKILDADGDLMETFAVGTGDTTGTTYGGQKYFSPVGSHKIKNRQPYDKVEGGYGPLWLGLTEKSYGLHGPHKRGDQDKERGGFHNEGFISHGCIRFSEEDILKVGDYLEVGSSVEILPYDTRPGHTGPLRVPKKQQKTASAI